MQRSNPLERTHQTWKHAAAGSMAAQSNLTEDHWILCYLDAIPKRGTLLNDKHATMTPYERIT